MFLFIGFSVLDSALRFSSDFNFHASGFLIWAFFYSLLVSMGKGSVQFIGVLSLQLQIIFLGSGCSSEFCFSQFVSSVISFKLVSYHQLLVCWFLFHFIVLLLLFSDVEWFRGTIFDRLSIVPPFAFLGTDFTALCYLIRTAPFFVRYVIRVFRISCLSLKELLLCYSTSHNKTFHDQSSTLTIPHTWWVSLFNI